MRSPTKSSTPDLPAAPSALIAPTGPDPVPPELAAVIALFDDALARVSFPDVDAARLRALADDARRLAAEVERVRRALTEAELTAQTALDALGAAAQRGLAYARIYAQAAPERHALAAALDALEAPRAPAVVGARRGRPRKIAAPSLFGADVAAPAA